jgi:ATP-binding protein involved in chromosome partitioning
MKIAIPLNGLRLAEHFGHCEQFILIDADFNSGNISRFALLAPPAHEPGVLPCWLQERGTEVIIADGIGQRAQRLFAKCGITIKCGTPGESPENLVQAWSEGRLETEPVACNHEGCH